MTTVTECLPPITAMQLAMTLQYHDSIERGEKMPVKKESVREKRADIEKLYTIAVRISVKGDEVWMQSKLLHITALFVHVPGVTGSLAGVEGHGGLVPPHLVEGLNRYRRLVRISDAAWLRWCGALALPLPVSLLDTYSRQVTSSSSQPHADGVRMYAEFDAAFTALQTPRDCSSGIPPPLYLTR